MCWSSGMPGSRFPSQPTAHDPRRVPVGFEARSVTLGERTSRPYVERPVGRRDELATGDRHRQVEAADEVLGRQT